MEVTIISSVNRSFFTPFLPSDTVEKNAVLFGLMIDRKACGCAQYAIEGHQATLNHIFVAEGYRRRGGGSLLLAQSRSQLWRYGLSELVCDLAYLPWDAKSYQGLFLDACGFKESASPARVYSAPLVSYSHRFSKIDHHACLFPLSHFTADGYLPLLKRAKSAAIAQDLAPILRYNDLDQNLSTVVIEEDTLTGYLMVRQLSPLHFEIAGLHYAGTDKRMVPRLLSIAVSSAMQCLPPETKVTALIQHLKMEQFLDRVLTRSPHTKYPVHHFIFSL